MKSRVLLSIVGALSSVGNMMIPTTDYTQRKVRALGHKKGGKPFTRGARSKSLKIRANRRKAQAKNK